MDSADIQLVWHKAPGWGQRQGRTDTMAVPRPRLVDTDSLRLLAKPQGRLMPDEGPVFGFSAPLDSLDPTQVTVWVDSVEVEAEWELTWSQLKLNSLQVQRSGKSVQVSFRPGALVREDAQAMWPQDTVDLVWSTLPQDALSTWRLKLEDVVCPGWLEVALGPDQVDLVRIHGGHHPHVVRPETQVFERHVVGRPQRQWRVGASERGPMEGARSRWCTLSLWRFGPTGRWRPCGGWIQRPARVASSAVDVQEPLNRPEGAKHHKGVRGFNGGVGLGHAQDVFPHAGAPSSPVSLNSRRMVINRNS